MPRFKPFFRGVLVAVLVTSLSACSYVASLFPDKQKQYRYSSEIPDLEIPPDLTSSTIEGARQAKKETAVEDEAGSTYAGRASGEEEAGASGSGRGEDGETPPESSSASATEKPAKSSSAPGTTLAQGTDDVPLIEIDEPFAEAWNDTGRALGRLELEVSDQNRSDGVFYVYYGGDVKKYKDRGLLGDLVELFTGNDDQSQEFRIKLEEKGSFTNISVLDQSGKAVSEGLGFDLLQRLNEKLQTLDKPEPEQARSEK
jgi:outer membrane protein assembly factor BamC